jgi:hypothetical protein
VTVARHAIEAPDGRFGFTWEKATENANIPTINYGLDEHKNLEQFNG